MQTTHVIGAILVVLFLILAPYILTPYLTYLLTWILLWCIFAMAYNLCFGLGGMLSFCHGVFFGLGGFGVAWSISAGLNPWFALLIGISLATISSLLIGFISLKTRKTQFAILTLIITTIAYDVSLRFTNITGGVDGITFSIPKLVLGNLVLPLSSPAVRWYTVSISFLISFYIYYRIFNSPFGLVLKAIKTNEERCRFIGYDTTRLLLMAFVASGFLSGICGSIFSLIYGFACATYFEASTSIYGILWTYVGGLGTLLGPIVGCSLLVPLTDYLSAYFRRYWIVIGALLIVCIYKFPKGIIGYLIPRLLTRKTLEVIRK